MVLRLRSNTQISGFYRTLITFELGDSRVSFKLMGNDWSALTTELNQSLCYQQAAGVKWSDRVR
jgi:hypothetical protein